MALFGGKRKPEEPEIDPEVERLNQAWAKLDHHIGNNPLFAMMTFDKLNWIDPFSGEIVPAPFGTEEVARKYFAEHDHWQRGQTKNANDMQIIRWLHWIRNNIRSDDRLRIFNPLGLWMNPVTATFSLKTKRVNGKVGPDTLRSMAIDMIDAGAKAPGDLKDMAALKAAIAGEAAKEESGEAKIIADDDFGTNLANESTESYRGPSRESGRIRAVGSGPTSSTDSAVLGLRSLFESIGDAKQKETEEDLEKARKVQLHMMGEIPKDLPGCEIAVHYRPYDAIGGDLYEIARLPNDRVFILIGDVTGHGVQAALVTTSAIKALRYITRQEQDLVEILCALNDSAKEDLISGQFITVWAAILDIRNRQIETVCAGHHPAMLGNPDKDVLLERIGNKGMAIGLMGSGILRKQLKTEHYQLEPGDVICQYTDGVSEIMHPERGEYGDFRVMGSFVGLLDQPLQAMLDGMGEMAELWTGQAPDDDVTIMAIRLSEPKNGDEAAEA